MSTALKTLLVHPPQFAMYSPFLAIPTVTAFARARGYPVDQWDLNILINRKMLERGWLEHCVERIQKRGSNIPAAQAHQALESSELVLERLPEALATLKRHQSLLDDETLRFCFGLLDSAYGIINAAHSPTEVSYNLKMRYATDRYAEVMAAIMDEDENPYLELYRNEFVPRVIEGGYGLVGIGLAFDEQLVPGLSFARVLKEMAPEVTIVGGGALLTKLAEPLKRLNRLFDPLDMAILYEGETPLVTLIEHLEGRAERDQVPNLLYPKKDGSLGFTHLSQEDLAELPAPDFSGFPLDQYLLPEVIFPMLTTRGCYWKKCAFCAHHHSYGWQYRVRHEQQLRDDIDTLKERFGARYFYFVDEAVPPSNLRVLADYGQSESGRGIRWFSDMRFEKALTDEAFCRSLYEGGCRALIFGMESGNQRVLDHMQKGVKLEVMSASLQALDRAGVFTILLFFTGFPTETVQEARETIDFINAHREQVGAYAQGHFTLLAGSPVQLEPEKYGVIQLFPPQNDLATDYAYKTRSGLSQAMASQISAAIGRQRLLDDKFGLNWSRELILLRQSLGD